MKEIIYVFAGLLIMASCAAPKEGESSARKLSANEKKIIRQEEVKQAVEMKRYLVRFDRLYLTRGGRIELIPKANYIIIDGERVIISAAYAGRQLGVRPVRGIDMVGKAESYQVKDKAEKGLYEISMKVTNQTNTFDVYLTISKDGYCDASMSSIMIDHVRYTGSFVPLHPKKTEDNIEKPDNSGQSSGEVLI
jgi:hypothetical protein